MTQKHIKANRTIKESKRTIKSPEQIARKKPRSEHYQNISGILHSLPDQKDCEGDIIVVLIRSNEPKFIRLESGLRQDNLWQNVSITLASIVVSFVFAILMLIVSLLIR